MQISISILISGCNATLGYVRNLIKSFKERVNLYPNSIFEAEDCLSASLKQLNNIGLLDNASLVITPNAYNEGKLYDVVPNTTLGDMDVVRATTATRVNSAGLIESVGLNIPRIDYTNGTCPNLLVEPQKTNLVTYSENFDNIYWNKQNIFLAINSDISPNGTNTADVINVNNSFGEHNVYSNPILMTPNINYTFSYFIKKGTGRYVATAIYYVGAGFGAYATYDLETNNLVASGAPNGIFTSTKIENFDNGWVRISVTGNGNSNSVIVDIDFRNAINLVPGIPYIGENESFSIWGAQLEQGSYPTSYIPTVASTVTRNSDIIYNFNISNFVGIDEGTVFFDIQGYTQQAGIGQPYWCYLSNNGQALFFYDEGVFSTVNGGFKGLSFLPIGTTPFKVAFKWNALLISLFINGVKVNEIAKTAVFNPINFSTANSVTSQQLYNSIQLYNTDLSDAECINLTTL